MVRSHSPQCRARSVPTIASQAAPHGCLIEARGRRLNHIGGDSSSGFSEGRILTRLRVRWGAATRAKPVPQAYAALRIAPRSGNSYPSPRPASYVARPPVGDANLGIPVYVPAVPAGDAISSLKSRYVHFL